MDQHELALESFSDNFKQTHIVKMAFPPVILPKKRRIALFYEIAGQSLTDFCPLKAYNDKNKSNLVVQNISDDLLHEWTKKPNYHPSYYGSEIIRFLFERRYPIDNNNIAKFLSEDLLISPNEGILIDKMVLPSAYDYLLKKEPFDNERKILLPLSPQHGDLNTGNILIQNTRVITDKSNYYLIDLFHFFPKGSFLFDIISLELSLIIEFVIRTQISIEHLLPDIAKLGSLEISNLNLSVEFGLLEILDRLRKNFINFIRNNAISYQDDWKASFNIAGIAAGLIATNMKKFPKSIRALAYIYAASHLHYYQDRFSFAWSKE